MKTATVHRSTKHFITSFLADNVLINNIPRYRKFILAVSRLTQSRCAPSSTVIAKRLNMSRSTVTAYIRELTVRHSWPFDKPLTHDYDYRFRFETKDTSVEDKAKFDRRIAAARKAKAFKGGLTIKNEDIEAFL